MPTDVPSAPRAALLRRLRVGLPVSSAHGRHWADLLAYLRAYNVEPIGSARLRSALSGSVTLAKLGYRRSPGVQVVLLAAELQSDTSTATATIGATLAGATLVGGSDLDGTRVLRCPHPNHRSVTTHYAALNVAGVSSASIQELVVTHTPVAGNSRLYRVTAIEVPLAQVDPDGDAANEAGISGAWPHPPNRLWDGSATGANGFVRVIAELDKARSEMRRHWQVLTLEDTNNAWTTTSTVMAALNWRNGYNPRHRFRSRRLYLPATPNGYTLQARYLAVSGGDLNFIVDGGAPSTLNLPASGAFASASTAVSTLCSTTDQEVTLEFQARTAVAADPLYVPAIRLIEAEA